MHEVTYNLALETLIARESERCSGLSWLHNRAEGYYAKRNSAIVLPTIVLSTLVGFLSGSSSSIFTNSTLSSIGIGSISLFAGVLTTIGNFFAFAKKTEAHRIASIQYGQVSRFLSIELTLPKGERIVAKDVLKITKDSIERLMETSPSIPEVIIREFQSRFNTSDVARPDIIDGLRRVYINTPRATELTDTAATIVQTPVQAVAPVQTVDTIQSAALVTPDTESLIRT